ncbi:DUF4352 domain-containing protein [Nocardia concava]|uniref:DUF4352 domain-containing protein n=1 Tax=Nocardia concava TaxID=257281 RepID=UPI0002FD5706|nr:DUF4352 domain-containing protein [Nocardia concava]
MIKLASGFALFAAIASTVAPATATAGTPVHDNNFEYAVIDVKYIGPLVVSDRGWRRADGTFAVVTLTITNISGKRQRFFGSNRLCDTRGRCFDEDGEATYRMSPAATVDEWSPLNPGESLAVRWAFDIPIDAEPAYVAMIELSDLFADPVKVPV